MTQTEFQHIAHTLPAQAGIYKYYDAAGNLLYVGKAKNLRKRVSSYFNKTYTNFKTHDLVQRISRVEFTIVNSEQDAFLLENALIKQYQPRFNINLKDDKTYPYIIIKNEPFPRVFLTRKKIPDGSEYVGPFTSITKLRELLDFMKGTIQWRTCKLNLSEQNIRKGKFKVCLEYHLGNCKGPCEALQTPQDYEENMQQLKNVLKGNISPVIQHFRNEMKTHAENLAFEKAAITHKKIENLERYQSRSVIVSRHLTNANVFSLLRDGDIAYINFLEVSDGTIVQTHTTSLEIPLEQTDEEILVAAIAQLRATFNSTASELIVPTIIEYPQEGIVITVPKGGDKKKLLDLSEQNVNYFREELRRKKTLQLEGRDDMERKKVLYTLQQDLQLQELPVHIECFDNSNFQGSFPVSAMVCFINGVPDKTNYRHFNVKTVEGINDFATMKEVVYRRYKRLSEQQEPLPQLIIIDGGKGQLNAAVEALQELNLMGKMTIFGLAKNEEELFFPGDQQSIKLPYNRDSLKLIRRIRDEVHRFGIKFHRNKRSKGTFKNALEQIKGIGKNTADQLLKEFKSVKKIRELSKEDLALHIGASRALIVWNYFHPEPAGEQPDDRELSK